MTNHARAASWIEGESWGDEYDGGDALSPDAQRELEAYRAAPAFASKPARDLTQAEAHRLVLHHLAEGSLALDKPVAFDRSGRPTYPRAGGRARVSLTMNGVRLVPNNRAARKWRNTGLLDLRMVVLLVRLVRHLAARWGATEIYWGGLGVGRSPDDRHGKGFAMDFHRALTRQGDLEVLRDWGRQRIMLIDGRIVPRWPPTTKETWFRLDPTSGPGAFFHDLYEFLTREACDHSRGPTTIGDPSFICHPDHPNPRLRATHADHVHLEIDR